MPADDPSSALVFTLDERRFALRLEGVERVVPAVEITPLPAGPAAVLGIINVAGEPVAVLDTRRALGLSQREMGVGDRLIITRTPTRALALVADAVEGVVQFSPRAETSGEAVAPDAGSTASVLTVGGGLVLVQELARLLSPADERNLDEALRA